MRLCGIISRFQLLSPCVRQVTHALLTRPPLSHKQLQSEEICRKCFVRLACVKHAASVHPEPGSNSHKKCLSASFEQTSFNSLVSVKTYCFKGRHLIISYLMSVRKLKISKNFQGCFTVQLSMFILLPAFFISADSFNRISCLSLFVNNFFDIFYFSLHHCVCLAKNKNHQWCERRRRDLNPRAVLPTCTLSRGVPSASWVLLLMYHQDTTPWRLLFSIFSS